MWVNAVGATTTQYIGVKPSSGGSGIVLNIAASGAGQVYSPGFAPYHTFSGITTGVWHHCILTVVQAVAGTVSLTIDATSIGTVSADTTKGGASIDSVIAVGATIGGAPTAELFVDDLFVYKNS